MNTRMLRSAWVTIVAWSLGGCALVNEASSLALSTAVPAQAVVNEQLVRGELVLSPDRTGLATLRADPPPADAAARADGSGPVLTSCVGRLRYTATTAGVVDLRCNDGAMAELRVTLIGDTRGYGYGEGNTGLASMVFGMTPREARAYLPLPPKAEIPGPPLLWPFTARPFVWPVSLD
ncbi:MAG: hypothetical protein IPH35_16260 [Rhodoferax sp.]|nr:hypothetical protein [Rhodoferax sp.]